MLTVLQIMRSASSASWIASTMGAASKSMKQARHYCFARACWQVGDSSTLVPCPGVSGECFPAFAKFVVKSKGVKLMTRWLTVSLEMVISVQRDDGNFSLVNIFSTFVGACDGTLRVKWPCKGFEFDTLM